MRFSNLGLRRGNSIIGQDTLFWEKRRGREIEFINLTGLTVATSHLVHGLYVKGILKLPSKKIDMHMDGMQQAPKLASHHGVDNFGT